MNLGDIRAGKVLYFHFTTRQFSTGAPITAASLAISVYKDDSTTQSTSGVTTTFTTGFDGVAGLVSVKIDTSADGTFYAAGHDFSVVITTGTADSVSLVGEVVGYFSIENRSALMPTTADRKLDVSAGGEAGLDWANIGSPTTAVNLSATNIDTDQVVASVTGAVGSVTGAVGSVTGAVGSVTGLTASDVGAIKAKTDNLPPDPADASDIAASFAAVTAAIPSAAQNADKLLGRSIVGGADGGRMVGDALKTLRNKVAIAAGTMTVYEADDLTPAFTALVTTAPGDPITSIDPA